MTAEGHRPPADVVVTEPLVRALLAGQHPDLAELPLTHAGGGWDNEMWRLGPELAVRLPRREPGALLAAHEQRWLPRLAELVPVAIPAPVRSGAPADGYPYPWSVVRWVVGTPAWRQPVPERSAWAGDLADALADLHAPAPPDAPENPFRGGPLAERDDRVRSRLAGTERAGLLDLWSDALAAPDWAGPAVWLHGDPHPANLLVRDGHLAGIVDFGDMTSGDPATDLSAAWLTFDAVGRRAFRARLEARGALDKATWRRSRGWAVALAAYMAELPEAEGVISAIGRHAVRELLAEASA